jgi:hypothetical protein
MVRLISIDIGNQYTGMVVVDSDPTHDHDDFTVQYINVVFDDTKSKEVLHQVVQDDLIPLIEDPKQTVLVMENVFMYRNYALHAVHRKLKKWFMTAAPGIGFRCLLPSQKSSGGLTTSNLSSGTDRQRKKNAIEAAKHLLTITAPDFTARIDAFERAHDVADALLAAHYLHLNPDRLPTTASRKRKRQSSS